jgi:uncharacterized coiled-coil protein SlyX
MTKKNKIISIILVICITIALLAGLYNYTIILGLNEDISLLESTNTELTARIDFLESKNTEFAYTIIELNEDIDELNTTNTELTAEIDVLSNQQHSYDLLLFTKLNNATTKNYVIQSGNNGTIELETPKFSEALEYISNNDAKTVKLKSGTYDLDADVTFDSKSYLIFDGQQSIINLNGHFILFDSDDHEKNRNNQVKNFNFYNGTFALENSLGTTIEDCNFVNCESAVEILNTHTWSEANKLENNFWNNCQTAITFKTPTGNATPSYENTVIDHCYFNLTSDNSVGIIIEEGAHFSNNEFTNSRIWMHASNNQTQTGLHAEGIMINTILSGVTFESFGIGTIYGIHLGENSTGFLDEGTTFLEKFESTIYNPDGKWMPGLFRIEPLNLTFGEYTTIDRDTFTIDRFGAIINIENISPSENVTVQITLNFRDHTRSESILLHFIENQTYELTAKNLYDIYPSRNTIKDIEFLAKTNLSNSETNVIIEVYGTAR